MDPYWVRVQYLNTNLTPDNDPVSVETCHAFKIYVFNVNIHLYTS
jgi:hypothetical protein